MHLDDRRRTSADVVSMEKWSLFDADGGADIFQVIENAILVAALDQPDELKRQRDTIVELCFKALLPPFPQGAKADHEIIKKDTTELLEKNIIKKDTELLEKNIIKKDSTELLEKKIIKKEKEDDQEEDRSVDVDVVEEVMRIKDILISGHHHDQADDEVLFDLLRSLQQLKITYDILEATHIGFGVKVLHKHTSKNIRHLARTVTLGWRKVVDEWVEATDAMAINSTAENLPHSGIPLALALANNIPSEEIKSKGVAKPAEPGRLPKLINITSQRQLLPPPSIPQRQYSEHDEKEADDKLEVAKRKLHEGYQRADNAKKQRTIKVIEQRNMPKKKGRRTLRPIQKLKNEIREWARVHSVKPPQKKERMILGNGQELAHSVKPPQKKQ